MKMGLADGVDLGWKLAAVSVGWGGPVLLDSYEPERRSTHEHVMVEAAANHSVLSNDLWRDGIAEPGAEGERIRAETGERIVAAKEREFYTIGTVLGGCYVNSPIIADGGGKPPRTVDSRIYEATSFPGCLAPHLWCADGTSLYDAFGSGFSLLTRSEAAASEVAAAVAEAPDIPLKVVRLTSQEAASLYPSMLTLVRTDQVVAWRGDQWEVGTLLLATGRRMASLVSGAA